MATAAELVAKFGNVAGITFEDDSSGPSCKAVLKSEEGECLEIYLFGAHIWRWQAAGKERLWQSSLSVNDGSAPLRGGLPIAWPQFADVGRLPLHGFARTCVWTVESVQGLQAEAAGGAVDKKVGIVLSLCSSDSTKKIWPSDFNLQYRVELGSKSLAVELEVLNAGSEALEFTTCFHTYFRTADIEKVAIKGLKGCSYIDKVDGFSKKVEEHAELLVERAATESKGFCDRIYQAAPETLLLQDGAGPHTFKVTQSAAAHPNTVIFNPWIEGKKGPKGPDYDDDGYKYAICIEPAIAETAKKLGPGEKWVGVQQIEVVEEVSS